MKVPVSWLKEYVQFEQPLEDLARILTLAGIEVSKIERAGDEWENIYIGQVERVERHPDADRLVLATVNYGQGHITVVTGAPNIAPGQKVALALAGALLNDAHSDSLVRKKLKPSKIRGVRSEGMVCSGRELGLNDEREGILALDPDAPIGAPLAEYLGDQALDIELQPNFAYANSVRGIAREVAAIVRGSLHLPAPGPLPQGAPGVGARVDGDGLATRYMLQRLDNLSIKPASEYIQERLRASGVRAINNVVDVTNYVMLEYGQPLHPFDASKVDGQVVVRAAHAREQLWTLDGQVRTMPPGTIMIADEQKAIGIGGIMGGRDSEVTESTTSILLESANFNPVQIRRSARGMGLRTDASARFERGIDPELAADALARAVELLAQEAGATPAGAPYDWYPVRQCPTPVRLEPGETERILGAHVPLQEIERVLTSLEFRVTIEGDIIHATPPSYRRDVTRPADLIEEIGRVWGYDRIPAALPGGHLPVQRRDVPALLERSAREWLLGAGLQEVINYSLTSPQALAPLRGLGHIAEGPSIWAGTENLVKVLNPLSKDREYLRPSLLPGLLQNVASNRRHTERIWLFELDRVFVRRGEKLPDEPKRLSIIISGPRAPRSPHTRVTDCSIFDLKGIVEGLLRALNVRGYSLAPIELGESAHNALALHAGNECAGYLFELAPEVLQEADVSGRVFATEINWDSLVRSGSLTRQFEPFSRFPPVRQDLAVLTPETIPAGTVQAVIEQRGGRMLRDLELVEVYSGTPLPPGQKSLLYRLEFGADDRTLTEEDASRYRQGIERALREQLGAQIRGIDTT